MSQNKHLHEVKIWQVLLQVNDRHRIEMQLWKHVLPQFISRVMTGIQRCTMFDSDIMRYLRKQ